MPRIEFKTIWTDSDGMLNLFIAASNGVTTGGLETYLYPEQLLEFARELERFPSNAQHEVIIQAGSTDPGLHDHFQMRAFVLNGSGHSALEVTMESRGNPPVAARSHFYLACNPADLNRVGTVLRQWLPDPAKGLSIEWRDA
jgi:hypothetical protein